ncbi:plasmid IncI1-type surface exclusion protein ExcA [Yersinia mollaretii]|uniref:plasmid IncI1-type surface exclusion protein ExcA n=1 Tax=Yersinia mollaretii TaxID=33060 RepID=UPI0025AA47CA|nr:plasmid IncI1-type surface exclusion protein ExcA [Yersinia mollaretii]MDN0112700.1 plasmid IncI1-type surface exclusion protein ExcA [Yersinia mollaretii]
MTVKHVDTYSKKWSVAFVGTLSGMYLVFGLPIHLALAGFIYAYAKFYGFQQSDITLSVFIWVSLSLVATLIITTISRQKRNIKAFTSYFSEKHFNEASPSNTAKSWTGLSYLALDTKNGTLLYINHPDTTIFNFFFPKDVRVMGFGMYDWKSIEVEGNTLRIYTGIPELPSVAISTGKASQLYEKINAMRNQTWTYENNVPGYVEHQAKRIADEQGLNLILPPN